MKIRPNFFIVGTPKAGTTSLYHYLEEHPDIYMSPIKETNFFSYKDIKSQGLFYGEEHVRCIEDYKNQFTGVRGEKAIGEASVSYLYYQGVAEKIKKFNPDAKIIIVLREPVSRGYSHYLMDKKLGLVNLSYSDIVNRSIVHNNMDLYYQQYVGLGFYYEQIKRYLNVFGEDKVKIFLFEDLTSDLPNVMKGIYKFLGVSQEFKAKTEVSHNSYVQPKNKFIGRLYGNRILRKFLKQIVGEKTEYIKSLILKKGKKPDLSEDLKLNLKLLYSENLTKTSKLINKDLSKWLE
ncbi:sulfotransferase family protein [Algoriphagus halophytocola]|uniref:Sulfotransferase n=1 Tax=Algoriphagus halophytocola TaxID=2991499 RepID=A0ABY6ML06_9BACT|nr:sulfotransferase [Algoriphagus sp. TR-M5]UZD23863.1 sulfotransferase [Algoriphagus sp. TR-M5]